MAYAFTAYCLRLRPEHHGLCLRLRQEHHGLRLRPHLGSNARRRKITAYARGQSLARAQSIMAYAKEDDAGGEKMRRAWPRTPDATDGEPWMCAHI